MEKKIKGLWANSLFRLVLYGFIAAVAGRFSILLIPYFMKIFA